MISGVSFARPRHFRPLLASSLAINMLGLALPLMTMQIYDRILSNRSSDTLIVLATGVFIAACMDFTLRCCRSVVTGLNGAHFEHEMGTAALRQCLETEPRHLAHIPSSTLVQDVGAAARLRDYYGGQMMVALLIDIPFVAALLMLQAYLTHWLVLVPCVVLTLFLYFSWRQGMGLRATMDKREKMDNRRYDFVMESLQSIHSIKALCMEAMTARRFEDVQRESGPLNYRIACLNGQSASLSYGFAQLMTVAVLCAGAPMAAHAHITIGTLIACVLLSGQIMQPLQRGLAMWMCFQDIALARKRLHSLLQLPQRDILPKLRPNYGELKLQHTCFSYVGGNPLFHGLHLSLAPGDTVAITGVSGSGKTTLLELITGIYAPDSGQVLIDGMDSARIPMSERARYVAYLPMQGMILHGSIMDNLTGFNPRLRLQAQSIARQLGIETAVSLLPAGYDTPLQGQLTDVISPGLKQRISIARALLQKPRLILFDNADHGMDYESYSRIFELMARLKGKTTLVLVSEDRNILSLADHVYDLRHGKLTLTAVPARLVVDRKFVKMARQ